MQSVKVSRYNIYQPLTEGVVLAYNSARGSFAVLEEEDYNRLTSDVARLPEHVQISLFQAGFLVDEALDELAAVRITSMIGRSDMSSLPLTIAPTVNCNLNCVYCYEQGSDKGSVMKPDIVDAIFGYVDERTHGRSAVNSVNLNWFGGEPLLCQDIVIGLNRRVREICVERDIKFQSAIITNGTLLTQDLVDELFSVDIFSYQFTIDGPPDIHNQRRPYASGKPTFDDVIRGVEFLRGKDKARPVIRINVDKTNGDRIEELVRELSERDMRYCHVGLGQTLSFPDCVGYEFNACFPTPEFAATLMQFRRIAERYGFKGAMCPKPRSSACGVDSVAPMTIGPDGETYKCWNDLGRKQRSTGHVAFDSFIDNPNLVRWMTWEPTHDPICKECNYLPICMGGCPAKPGLGFTTVEGHDCATERFVLDEMLKSYFLSKMPDPGFNLDCQEG